jgi:hypothetical protein
VADRKLEASDPDAKLDLVIRSLQTAAHNLGSRALAATFNPVDRNTVDIVRDSILAHVGRLERVAARKKRAR